MLQNKWYNSSFSLGTLFRLLTESFIELSFLLVLGNMKMFIIFHSYPLISLLLQKFATKVYSCRYKISDVIILFIKRIFFSEGLCQRSVQRKSHHAQVSSLKQFWRFLSYVNFWKLFKWRKCRQNRHISEFFYCRNRFFNGRF